MARALIFILWALAAACTAHRVAWVVPLTTSSLLQRFHVTVQSIHDTQRAEDRWIVAVASDEAVRDLQALLSVKRVTSEIVTITDGVTAPMVDYFVKGYAEASAYLVESSTVAGEIMYVVWCDVDNVFVNALHETLPDTITSTQIATVPTDTTALYHEGQNFVVLGHEVTLDVDKESLRATIANSAKPHVELSARFAARASDLHNYRDDWIKEKEDGCKVPNSRDEVLCGVSAVYYDLPTFGPWHWWTYPLLRVNYAWVEAASHVNPANIPWTIWILKIVHLVVIGVMLFLARWMFVSRPWLPVAKYIWKPASQLGPMQGHATWIVRIVFFVAYIAMMLFYPEEIWPWYGWSVALLWVVVMFILLLGCVYYPWMEYQGEYAQNIRSADLTVHARAYISEGESAVSLDVLAARARSAFWGSQFILFIAIVAGILIFGLLIGEGRTALIFLAAFIVSALSWYTSTICWIIHSTAFSAYEIGCVRRWKRAR